MNRISTSGRYAQFNRQIAQTQAELNRAQNQVLTGRRINILSEDPIGGSFALSARKLRTSLEQYTANLGVADDNLKHSEAALSEAGDLIKQAQAIAVRAATSLNNADANNAMIGELKTIQTRLVAIGNQKNGYDKFLFAVASDALNQGLTLDASPMADDAEKLRQVVIQRNELFYRR